MSSSNELRERRVHSPLQLRPAESSRWTTGLGYLAICALTGVIAGWLWNRITTSPTFVTGEDRTLAMTERSIMLYFTADAGFVLMGLVLGIGIGVLGWNWARGLDWLVVPLTAGGGLIAGASCWLIGWAIGPRNFEQRVAAAQPGDLVPIDFTLRSPIALVVWAITALLPVLLYSALSSEAAQPDPQTLGEGDKAPNESTVRRH